MTSDLEGFPALRKSLKSQKLCGQVWEGLPRTKRRTQREATMPTTHCPLALPTQAELRAGGFYH